jgi:hypothetical protein
MLQRFLHAKHWQMFLLLFVLPFVLQLICMVIIISQIVSNSHRNYIPAEEIFGYFFLFMFGLAIFMCIFLGWFYAIGTGLQQYIPAAHRLRTGFFKVTVLTPLVYFFIASILFFNFDGFFPVTLILIVPLHFFSIFCFFHNFYFVAKTVKTAEYQRSTTFGDYAGEFFLLWFYPVGVWFIQPKVNDVIAGKYTQETNDPSLSADYDMLDN